MGVPLAISIFRRFNELFTDRGGTFVNSTYLWSTGGTNRASIRLRPTRFPALPRASW